MQWLLANSAAELAAAQALLDRVADAVDAHTARGRDAAMVKLFATEVAGRVANHMLRSPTADGLLQNLPLERIYRDLRVQRIIEGDIRGAAHDRRRQPAAGRGRWSRDR